MIARGSRASAVSLVLCSVVSLQVGAALSSRLFDRIGPSGATLLRLGLAAVLLLGATRPGVRGWSRGQWRAVALLGVALAGMNGLFYEAVARLPLGIAVTVEFLGPLVLAAVLSRRGRELAWVGLALTGVAALGLTRSGDGGALSAAGLAFAAAAAAFWALYVLAGARVAAAEVGLGGLAVGTAIAALIVAPVGLASGGTALLSPSILGWGVLVALLASAIPYSCELTALTVLPRQAFSVLLALEPAAAAALGAILLGQVLTAVQGAAIAAVVAAGIGSTLAARPAPNPAGLPPVPSGQQQHGDGGERGRRARARGQRHPLRAGRARAHPVLLRPARRVRASGPARPRRARQAAQPAGQR